MVANDTTFVHNLRREVLAAYAEEGHRITVVAQVLSFREELEQMGCSVIETKISRRGTDPLADLKLLADYIRIFKKYGPDTVFTNNIKPNVYAGLACRILKIPYIVNVTGLGTAVEKPGKMQALTTKLYKMGVAGAAYATIISQAVSAFLVILCLVLDLVGKRVKTSIEQLARAACASADYERIGITNILWREVVAGTIYHLGIRLKNPCDIGNCVVNYDLHLV